MLRTFVRSLKRAGRVLAGESPLDIKPLVLFKFDGQRDVDHWDVYTDAYFGGKSQASWRLAGGSQPAAEFSGRCSTEMEEDADVMRAGYCCAASKVTTIGDYFDLEPYSHLVYTVKGDGNVYMANIRVDTLAGGGGDVWQAAFETRRGADWSEVRIPLGSFVMTNKGRLVERRMEMARDKVMSVGISVSAMGSFDHDYRAAMNTPAAQPAAAFGSLGTKYPAAVKGTGRGSGASAAASSSGGVPGQGGECSPSHNSGEQKDGDDEDDDSPLVGEFHLLLREIRAEGRAGYWQEP